MPALSTGAYAALAAAPLVGVLVILGVYYLYTKSRNKLGETKGKQASIARTSSTVVAPEAQPDDVPPTSFVLRIGEDPRPYLKKFNMVPPPDTRPRRTSLEGLQEFMDNLQVHYDENVAKGNADQVAWLPVYFPNRVKAAA